MGTWILFCLWSCVRKMENLILSLFLDVVQKYDCSFQSEQNNAASLLNNEVLLNATNCICLQGLYKNLTIFERG